MSFDRSCATASTCGGSAYIDDDPDTDPAPFPKTFTGNSDLYFHRGCIVEVKEDVLIHITDNHTHHIHKGARGKIEENFGNTTYDVSFAPMQREYRIAASKLKKV